MTMLSGSNTGGNLNNLTPKAATYQHPAYTDLLPIWRKLAHVRTGKGGFLDGTYLIAHPREWVDYTSDNPRTPTKKLKARRNLATYDNVAGRIIEAKKSALFRQAPSRRVGDGSEPTDGEQQASPIEDWWENVDGRRSMNDFWPLAWDGAATFGHIFVLMDRYASTEEAATMADVEQPYLRLYAPADVPDWVEDDRGDLVMAKFIEPVARVDIWTPAQNTDYRIRIVDTERWYVHDKKGKLINSGEHGMGRCPVVRLYAQRDPFSSLGLSILDSPQHYIDLYNLRSELRELLRNQTFSLLNIPLGTGPDAMTRQNAIDMLGQTTGTEDVIFSGLAASFISADAANVLSYQQEIERVLRLIYRIASIQWESDSKDAEATGSMELKREDMNQTLSAYAGEVQATEDEINELWYRAMYGADSGPEKFKRDMVTVVYPQTFGEAPVLDQIELLSAAMAAGLPDLVQKEMKKRLLPVLFPDAPPELVAKMEKEIEAEPKAVSPAEETRQRMELSMESVKQGGKPKPGKAA